ncbi:MAG: YqaJ viral recombinase family protein [Acidaminococcaceae bacterium]|nr:YqaJ viral recombinase family protein [Acidaminococcaceae bacterium]
MDAKLILTVEDADRDHSKWLAVRNMGIGGSDAGVLMGANPWKSKYALWQEKTGLIEPEDISEKDIVWFGSEQEPIIAKRFMQKTGKTVHRCGTLRNNKDPWMLANVDRLVVNEDAGLEIKTTNAFSAKEWDDDKLPDSYYWQCQHYMMTTGLPLWYIAVLIGGQDFRYKEVPRCEGDIKALYKAEKDFWEVNVQQGIQPEIDGSDATTEALKEQYPGGETEPLELPPPAGVILGLYDVYKTQEKEAKAKVQEAQNMLMSMMGDCEIATFAGRKVTWKTRAGSTTIDRKKLQAEYRDAFDACKKVGNPTRVFKVHDKEE